MKRGVPLLGKRGSAYDKGSMLNIAINGCGRIGRHALKIIRELPDARVVAVNDLTEASTLAHLIRHDTVYRTYHRPVTAEGNYLSMDGQKIPVSAEKDPTKLPWKEHKVDVVLECTGRFTDRLSAEAHLKAGAKRVIISAPPKGSDVPTFVIGVNDSAITGKEEIVSNASCTTNCLAPMMAIMQAAFGIKKSLMTTVHAYTASQSLQDGPSKDLREARAAAENVVPTSTGAARAVGMVLPTLKTTFDGLSIRVPVPVVSLSDCTMLVSRPVTVEEVNQAFRDAAASVSWKGLVEVEEGSLVSSDFIGNPASCTIDAPLTRVVDGDLVKVVGWYDNEWGYTHRLIELALLVGKRMN